MAKSSASHVSLAMANRRVGKTKTPVNKVHAVDFSKANGGLVSTTRSKSEGGDSFGGESQQTIHPSMSHAVAHLKQALSHAFEDDGTQ